MLSAQHTISCACCAVQLEACKSAISSQGLQRAYGFLLSMFEDQQTDHVEMLQSMPVSHSACFIIPAVNVVHCNM